MANTMVAGGISSFYEWDASRLFKKNATNSQKAPPPKIYPTLTQAYPSLFLKLKIYPSARGQLS